MVRLCKISVNHTDFEHVRSIRSKVFVQEQKVSAADEYDAFEFKSTHYLLKINGQPIGVARSRKTHYGIKLERFAILREFRGLGMGKKIVQEVIKDVIKKSENIYLHAQLPVVDFYSKLGFHAQGRLFSEAGIDHYKMVLQLDGPVKYII